MLWLTPFPVSQHESETVRQKKPSALKNKQFNPPYFQFKSSTPPFQFSCWEQLLAPLCSLTRQMKVLCCLAFLPPSQVMLSLQPVQDPELWRSVHGGKQSAVWREKGERKMGMVWSVRVDPPLSSQLELSGVDAPVMHLEYLVKCPQCPASSLQPPPWTPSINMNMMPAFCTCWVALAPAGSTQGCV